MIATTGVGETVLTVSPSFSRPARRLPSLWTIAGYWHTRDGNPLMLDAEAIEWPYCFSCSRMAPADESAPPARRWKAAASLLDRAHLVDRIYSGLHGPQNLVPLCHACHKRMPCFQTDQGAEAMAWVIAEGEAADMRLFLSSLKARGIGIT